MSVDTHLGSKKLDISQVNVLKHNFVDQWILSSLSNLITELEFAYKTYRFDIAAQKLYEFVWNEFCDWYLELVKVNLANSIPEGKNNTLTVLLAVLDAVLKLLHPLLPFLTEELWQKVKAKTENIDSASIMIAKYPHSTDYSQIGQFDASPEIELLRGLVTAIRNLRAEMNLNPGVKVPLIIEGESTENLIILMPYIMSLAKISEVNYVAKLENKTNCPMMLLGSLKFMLEVKIDTAQEKLRLEKELAKTNVELEKIQVKLNNPSFSERAPKDLVEREIKRKDALEQLLATLHIQLSKTD
jgi:valyl-tRNA synthetase